jgi:hypothetical protein
LVIFASPLRVGTSSKHGQQLQKAWRRDKGYVQATITPAGRGLIAKMFPAHARRISEVMGRLTSGEQEVLGTLCGMRVRANAEAYGL